MVHENTWLIWTTVILSNTVLQRDLVVWPSQVSAHDHNSWSLHAAGWFQISLYVYSSSIGYIQEYLVCHSTLVLHNIDIHAWYIIFNISCNTKYQKISHNERVTHCLLALCYWWSFDNGFPLPSAWKPKCSQICMQFHKVSVCMATYGVWLPLWNVHSRLS